jgi:hypothetical protein
MSSSNGKQSLRTLIRSLSPITVPRLPTLTVTSSRITEQFNDIRASSVTVEARKECAYRFLEEVFLPLVKENYQLTCETLLEYTREFKANASCQHLNDFDDFDLIASIEVKLELLQLSASISPELHHLLVRAFNQLQALIEQCAEDFFR